MFKINSGLVRKLMLERGLPIATFATAAGLNVLTVKRVLRDGATATIRTISALAKFFDVPADELILKAEKKG